MSLARWNAGKARLDNGSRAVTYESGVSRVHVNTENIRQLIKPRTAGTFATHPVSLAPRDNKSETLTPSGRPFRRISFIKATQSCLAGQCRAGNTSKVSRDNLSHRSLRSMLLVENGVQLCQSRRPVFTYTVQDQSRRPVFTCPIQDHKHNMPNMALWSALPHFPRSPC
jgi:hypothetical protein